MGNTLFYRDNPPVQPAACKGTVVMVHGFARNGEVWDGWVPHLTQGYRVIRPDLHGCGESPAPNPGVPFRFEDAVADYIGFIDQHGFGPVHHVGELTGGMVGIAAAARRPELFSSLVLVSTPSNTFKAETGAGAKAPGASSPEASLAALGLHDWWLKSRAITGELFGDERDEMMAASFAKTPVHVAVAMWEGMHRPGVDVGPCLPKIAQPVLVMSPTKTHTMPLSNQVEMAAALPNAIHKIYQGAAHGMYYLMPDMLAKDCIGFLDRVTG